MWQDPGLVDSLDESIPYQFKIPDQWEAGRAGDNILVKISNPQSKGLENLNFKKAVDRSLINFQVNLMFMKGSQHNWGFRHKLEKMMM